jgi:hypothetical protein
VPLPVIEKPAQSIVTFCAVTLKQVAPIDAWSPLSVQVSPAVNERPQAQEESAGVSGALSAHPAKLQENLPAEVVLLYG